MIPGINIRFGQIETPIEDAGKWVYKVDCVTSVGMELPLGLYGPFDTRVEAETDCDKMMEWLEKNMKEDLGDDFQMVRGEAVESNQGLH